MRIDRAQMAFSPTTWRGRCLNSKSWIATIQCMIAHSFTKTGAHLEAARRKVRSKAMSKEQLSFRATKRSRLPGSSAQTNGIRGTLIGNKLNLSIFRMASRFG